MRIAFLTVNNCWVILFGDSIIDLDGRRFFNDLADLKADLRIKGLKVIRRKIVSSDFNPLVA